MANEERIDKWLWAMRIFKTRTIATEACKKGRITIGEGDGVIAKPSRTIKIGCFPAGSQPAGKLLFCELFTNNK